MKYLLDTHVLIWSLIDRKKLSKRATEILKQEENIIFVSPINFWEISLKYFLKRIDISHFIPEDFYKAAKQTGYEIAELSCEDSITIHNLSGNHHKDPFDKMLIWQAIRHNYILITKDNEIKKYKSAGLTTIW